MLYHISDKPDLCSLTPHIPASIINGMYEEENTIPRVCFSPTITGCLRALLGYDASNTFNMNDYTSSSYVTSYDDCSKLDQLTHLNTAFLDNIIASLELKPYPYIVYHAYIPLKTLYNEFYKPTTKEVYDQKYTGEVWLRRSCQVRKAFSFIVTGCNIIDEFDLVNENNGKIIPYQLREYAYQIVSEDMLEKYLICDRLLKNLQIELFKLKHNEGD